MWLRVTLLGLCLVTFVAGLGNSAIQDSDEAYYAEAGREIVASGDWIVPHYNFEPRLNKPVLFYWLIAATYTLTGVTEWAARVWAGLSGLGLAMLAFHVGRRCYDTRTGAIAGAIVATSFGLVPIARQSLPDVPLAFFASVAAWFAIQAFSLFDARGVRSDATAPSRRRWLFWSALATALAILTKGPVGLVTVGLVIAAIVLSEWRGQRAAGRSYRLPIGIGPLLVAAAIVVAVSTPWFLAVTRLQGISFLHTFIVGENIERFATSRFNAWRGWDYFPIMVGGLMPWSAFALLWVKPIADAVRRRQAPGPLAMRLLLWGLAPLAFFFVSVGSQPRYILPCLTPLAILLAHAIAQHLAQRDRTFVVAAALAGVSIASLGLLVYRAEPVLQALSANSARSAAIAAMVAGCLTVVGAVLVPRRFVPVLIAAGAAVGLVTFDRVLVAPGRPEPVEVMAAAAREAGMSPDICACGAFARSLNYYTHVKTVIADTGRNSDEALGFLLAPDRRLAVVDSGTLADVEARSGRTFRRIHEVSYLNTSMWLRPSFLFRPDPAAIQRVVLVSTQ